MSDGRSDSFEYDYESYLEDCFDNSPINLWFGVLCRLHIIDDNDMYDLRWTAFTKYEHLWFN